MAETLRKIVVIGGTGAQGIPVVKELSSTGKYKVVVVTRDSTGPRAKALLEFPNVELFQGTYTSEEDLNQVFEGAYGAYVNTDGFTIGEKLELYFGFRIFEIAVLKGIKHYVWGNLDYLSKKGGYQPKYRCGHYDGKGRIAEWLLAQAKGQPHVTITILTSGPYMEMLHEGMLNPKKREDDVFEFNAPLGEGAVPVIVLSDLGFYARWIFDNPLKANGLDLEVATEHLGWQKLVDTFTKVTGQKAVYNDLPLEEFFKWKGIPENVKANYASGEKFHDPSSMTSWQNFSGFWNAWKDNIVKRDYALLDEIHPQRIKNVEEWMRKTGYDGNHKEVLKNHDLRRGTKNFDVKIF